MLLHRLHSAARRQYAHACPWSRIGIYHWVGGAMVECSIRDALAHLILKSKDVLSGGGDWLSRLCM